MIRLRTFNEAIYGNMAVVYHRTSASDLINKVYTSGFTPGNGAMYGKGFYSTYELNAQEQSNMSQTYGTIVVKFIVPIEQFLIFDPEVYIKSPLYKKLRSKVNLNVIKSDGKNKDNYSYLWDQFNYFKIGRTETNRLEIFNRLPFGYGYTSDMALHVYNKDSALLRKVNGVVFTGRHDGQVLLAYNTKIIMPVSYKSDGSTTFDKVEMNKEYFKKMLLAKANATTGNRSEDLDISEDAIYSFDKNKNILWEFGTWRSGIWENGIWTDGLWQGGTWENGAWKAGNWLTGTWENGVWHKGIWEDGTWAYGTWKSGTWRFGNWFDGIWDSGTWHNGIWEDGTWKSGTWYNGIWEDGIWEDGTWQSGRWKLGTWKNGDWLGGKWQGGSWEDGTWQAGNWISGVWNNGTWKTGDWVDGHWFNGTWHDGDWGNGKWYGGIWKHGQWYNGIWENGTWLGGTWYDGIWKGGEWLGGTWKNGWILDPDHKGNFDPSWKWTKDLVESPLSPAEYWAGKK